MTTNLLRQPTSISSLITDIYSIIQQKDTGWFTHELAARLGEDIASRLRSQLGDRRPEPRLRLSQMGPRCPRALWYSIHQPAMAEALPPWAEIKYSFGHTLEALAVSLARAAGHEVLGEQDEVSVDGIIGHRDCVIDGCIVDVKSCSQRSFDKFKSGLIAQMDDFGYLDQLDGYVVGSANDELVRCKDRGYILAVNKVLGHLYLYEHKIRPAHIKERIRSYKSIVGRDSPPECECGTVPDGKSGNIKLDTRASYNVFKFCCRPTIRTFLYADGIRYLTHVERKPDVPEIDKEGNLLG